MFYNSGEHYPAKKKISIFHIKIPILPLTTNFLHGLYNWGSLQSWQKKIYEKNEVNNPRFFPNYRMDVYGYHKQYFIVDHGSK